MKSLAVTFATGLLIFAAPFALSATAQESFPSRPIRLVMPVPPGSAPDVVARLVSDHLGRNLGQAIIVENRPGGGGVVAAQAVATAPPDGHTLLGGASSVFTILPAQKEKLSIDVNRDLTQVGMLMSAAMYLAVSPQMKVNTLADFVALAKSQPQQIVIGTNSAGTLPHYTAIAFAKRAGLPVSILPYNTGGTAEAIRDIMGGRVHATIEAYAGIRGTVDSGDLRLIGVMSEQREAHQKDVPALAESLPGFTSVGFVTIAAPAGTPGPVIDRINAALNKALQEPSVSQRLDQLGLLPRIMTPAETKLFVESEQKIWWPLVRENSGH